jgi:hypothetical protein
VLSTTDASRVDGRRECAWCGTPFAPARPHAVCCSTRCRQARHRFTSGVGRGVASHHGAPLRLAYADPPYPGLSKRYYGEHPDYAGEVDHAALIASLVEFDGWALSTSAKSLPAVLALCPPGVRVAAWVRGERPTKAHGPLNAWEPVIFSGGRASSPTAAAHDASRVTRATRRGDHDDASTRAAATRSGEIRDASFPPAERVAQGLCNTRRATPATTLQVGGMGRRVDVLIAGSTPRLTDPRRVVGAKPAVFCRWVFDLLGAQPGDLFVDVFPGSGGVARAWEIFANGA